MPQTQWFTILSYGSGLPLDKRDAGVEVVYPLGRGRAPDHRSARKYLTYRSGCWTETSLLCWPSRKSGTLIGQPVSRNHGMMGRLCKGRFRQTEGGRTGRTYRATGRRPRGTGSGASRTLRPNRRRPRRGNPTADCRGGSGDDAQILTDARRNPGGRAERILPADSGTGRAAQAPAAVNTQVPTRAGKSCDAGRHYASMQRKRACLELVGS